MEYTLNNVIIALDAYSENDNEGSYIRMKFNNKEAILEENKPGKLLIQTKSKKKHSCVNGFDRLYSSIKCQGQRQ